MPKAIDRQKLWEVMRKRCTFTDSDLNKTKVREAMINTYVEGLTMAGYIEVTKMSGVKNTIASKSKVSRPIEWKLIKDIGNDAPQVTKQGKEDTSGIGNQQMWRTMKMLKTFTYKDLAINASTEEIKVSSHSAKHYMKFLCRAGYIKLINRRKGVYQFITAMNTGDRPPIVQALMQVVDQNNKEVVWSQE